MTPPYDIQDRSFAFACDVIVFCRRLRPVDDVGRRLSWQLLDAGTSIGANLEEEGAGHHHKRRGELEPRRVTESTFGIVSVQH